MSAAIYHQRPRAVLKNPPKNSRYARCPLCERRTLAAKVEAHGDTVECQTAQVHASYRLREWEQVNAQHGKIIRDAGLPCELARGGYLIDHDGTQQAYDVFFAPRVSIAVMQVMNRVRMSAEARRLVLVMLNADPDKLAAVDTVRRLGGDVRSYLLRMMRSMEPDDGE